MIGQAYCCQNKKYNIIILASGAGSRMGNASDYIPKALTKLGNRRAIDYIIDKYSLVAHKFIISTVYHSDLLEHYIRGKYKNIEINFVKGTPEEFKNNAYSTAFCLDHANSRIGTILVFCDLLIISNNRIVDDSVYYVNKNTKGKIGTFRHVLVDNKFIESSFPPYDPNDEHSDDSNGIIGTFVFSNTPLLKSITYSNYDYLNDLTDDIVKKYFEQILLTPVFCDTVYEFGTEQDLKIVRELWEQAKL